MERDQAVIPAEQRPLQRRIRNVLFGLGGSWIVLAFLIYKNAKGDHSWELSESLSPGEVLGIMVCVGVPFIVLGVLLSMNKGKLVSVMSALSTLVVTLNLLLTSMVCLAFFLNNDELGKWKYAVFLVALLAGESLYALIQLIRLGRGLKKAVAAPD